MAIEAPKWSLGLRGISGIVANASAVAIIMILFWQQNQASQLQAREDRLMFREELKELRADSIRQWELIRKSSDGVQELTSAVRQGSKDVGELVGAVQKLTNEIRKQQPPQ